MNVVILSRRRSLHTTQRLKQEFVRAGFNVRILDPLKCVLTIRNDRPGVLSGTRPIRDVDVVVPRVGMTGTAYTIAVVRQFDLMGVPCFNNHGPIARARNKLGALQLLAKHDIPVPETLMARAPRNLEALLKRIGGAPVVIKLMRGTQGTGVMLAETAESAQSFVEAIWSLGEDIMLQQFVSECRGIDRRIMVCGDRVIAAMQRVAKPGEFRSNIHRGGLGHDFHPSREEVRVALKATRVLGLDWAGVDILPSRHGPRVIEVNATPGLRGIEDATKLNIAREVAQTLRGFVGERRSARRA